MKTYVIVTDGSGGNGKGVMGYSETCSWGRTTGLTTAGAKNKDTLSTNFLLWHLPFFLRFFFFFGSGHRRKTFLFLEGIFETELL